MPAIRKKIKLGSFLMIVSNGISLLVILVFFLLLYSSTSGYIYEIADSVNRSEFEYLVSSVEQNYNEIMNISKNMSSNKILKGYISTYMSEYSEINNRINALEHIRSILIGLKNHNKLIKSINIIKGEKQLHTLDFLISYNLLQKLTVQRLDDPRFSSPDSTAKKSEATADNYLIHDLDDEIYISQSIFDNDSFFCNAYILLDKFFFRDVVSGRKDVMIYDEKENILYNSVDHPAYDDKYRNLEYYINALETSKDAVVYKRSLNNGWTVLYVFNKDYFTLKQKPLNIILLYSLLASFLCSIVLSNYLSGSVLRPVYSIMEFMTGYRYANRGYGKYVPAASGKKMTLRGKIFYYFISTIMLPVFIFVMLFYFQTTGWAKEQISGKYSDTFIKTAGQVDKFFETKAAVFQNVLYSLPFQEFIFNSKHSDESAVIETLRNYKYLGLENNEITVYSADKSIFFSNYINSPEVIDDESFSVINSRKHGFTWKDGHDELNNKVFTLLTNVMPILVADYYSNRQFYAMLRIPYKDISEIFSNLNSSTSEISITDSWGTSVFHKASEKPFTKEITGDNGRIEYNTGRQKYVVFFHRIPRTSWYVTAKYSYQDITRQSSAIIRNNVYIVIIVFLLIAVLSYFISLIILKPVNIFNNVLENYRLDDIDADLLKDSFINEIDNLGINFSNMIERIEDLFDDLLITNREKNQLMLQIKAAEMVALQAQINPHFLYNTLDNLLHLIDNGRKEKAHRVVHSLSRLFRFGISRGDRIIPLSEEIAYARAYAEIISIRYGEGISFMWDLDESLLEFKTLKLILQPLIENAVFHGFKNMKENCIISISCFQQSGSIKLAVSDNGEGISVHKLDEIRKDLRSENIEDKVGIFNVQARIRLQYGLDYGLDIESGENEGTVVTITIPRDEEGLE